MGLDVSHDAFSGAYSAFSRFRQIVARAMGGSFPPHSDREKFPEAEMWYWGEGFSQRTHPGLFAFMVHSDCDGSIMPSTCGRLADELEALLPEIEKLDNGGGGHIQREGGYAAVTKRFIAGCRRANAERRRLIFH